MTRYNFIIMTSYWQLSAIIRNRVNQRRINVVLSSLDNIPRSLSRFQRATDFDWVISLKLNRATSGYISLIRVRSSVTHPTASRREIRDRRASLIASFPSQASLPFPSLPPSLLPPSLFLSPREFSRLSTAVVNYCRREFHRSTLPDLRSYEAYRGL